MSNFKFKFLQKPLSLIIFYFESGFVRIFHVLATAACQQKLAIVFLWTLLRPITQIKAMWFNFLLKILSLPNISQLNIKKKKLAKFSSQFILDEASGWVWNLSLKSLVIHGIKMVIFAIFFDLENARKILKHIWETRF